MKKNGFTLIEILAVIVIIAIIGGIAIMSVSNNILKSREASFVDLAKAYMESARTMKAKDNLYYEPKTNEVVIIPCNQINGTEIEHKDVTGYGNVIDDYCYVGVEKNGDSNYSYYMTIVDDTYHILNGKEYNSVSNSDIVVGSENLAQVAKVATPLSSFDVKYGTKTYAIRAVRMKYTATYQDSGTKSATLYGYYTNDGTQNSTNANIKGTISELDTFLLGSNKNKTINGVTYKITNSEVLYIVAKK